MENDPLEEIVKKALNSVDETIKNGPWNESNFLRMIGKGLGKIRDDIAGLLSDSAPNMQVASNLTNRVAARVGQVELFIGLYCSDGFNVFSWERIVVNLPDQMVSRPVYAHEEDIKEMIRGKSNKINEAYISAFVDTDAIIHLPPEKTLYDKLNKPMVSLKDGAVRLDNLHRFVHLTGIYDFGSGRLVKQTASK